MDLPSPPHLSHNHSVTPREMANSICDTLRRSGYEALLVGGCVRDLLLGREPADYDVTTDATPEKVVSLFPESIAVGAQFGVILIPRDGLKVEVATFRSTWATVMAGTQTAWFIRRRRKRTFSAATLASTDC